MGLCRRRGRAVGPTRQESAGAVACAAKIGRGGATLLGGTDIHVMAARERGERLAISGMKPILRRRKCMRGTLRERVVYKMHVQCTVVFALRVRNLVFAQWYPRAGELVFFKTIRHR